MSENDFREKIENNKDGRPVVTYNESAPKGWVFKIAYPIRDKRTLQQYFLDYWKRGVLDDEKLERCYEGIKNDIEQLITEGWIRVIYV